MANDVAGWLRELGLDRYAAAFAENDIDFRALAELSDDDLKELGVSLGHRRVLQRAIKQMSQVAASTIAGPAPTQMPTQSPSTTGLGAERRHLTVLFSDLVGSTALSADLDPEDMRDLIRAYQDACAGVITRFEGYIAKFMGDGVLAYFGFPQRPWPLAAPT